MESVDVVREIGKRLNGGDIDAMLDLCQDDVVMQPDKDWPDTARLEGKAAFRKTTEEWLSVWQSIELETDEVDAYGDRVVAHGCWRSTGRVSGVEGELLVHIVFTVRDGRIARLEWFPDHASAVSAARGDA